jgi:hypothetical protein
MKRAEQKENGKKCLTKTALKIENSFDDQRQWLPQDSAMLQYYKALTDGTRYTSHGLSFTEVDPMYDASHHI